MRLVAGIPMKQEILLGDAYKLIKSVPDGSVDFVFTDPPYLFDSINFVGWRGAKGDVDKDALKKGVNNNAMIPELVRALKKRGGCALWCNKAQLPGYFEFFKGWKFEVFVWIKTNVPSLYGTYFLHDKEYLLVFWRGGALRGTDWDNCHTYFISGTNQHDKAIYGHPTIKPIKFVSQIIRAYTDPGDMVLDPFSGSGTTAVACKELGRDFLGFEIDPEWHKVALDRLNGQTREEAKAKIVQEKLF